MAERKTQTSHVLYGRYCVSEHIVVTLFDVKMKRPAKQIEILLKLYNATKNIGLWHEFRHSWLMNCGPMISGGGIIVSLQ